MIPENDREKVLCIGNLYTENGIQYIVKNSLLCPRIKGFILMGNDKNDVRKTFLSKEYYYNRDGNFKLFYSAFIETELCVPVEDNDINSAFSVLNKECKRCDWIKEPIDCYSEDRENSSSLPSEQLGFHVRDSSLENMWHKSLTYIKRFGQERVTSSGKKYREILGLTSVLECSNEPIKMPENAPLYSTIETYTAQIITDSPQSGIEYTYGQRLHAHAQVDTIIEKLKADKANRQAIGVTWNLPKDGTSLYPPCCVLADFKVQPGIRDGSSVDVLYLTLYFRSHDIYSAYCANIYGFRKMQEMIAVFTDCVPGYMMIVSDSAHVYDYDYPRALIYEELGCRLDPRGYFIIELIKDDARIIKLTYMSPSDQTIAYATGLDVQELCDFAMPYVSEISHAIYLGRELQRARHCIDNGVKYVQS